MKLFYVQRNVSMQTHCERGFLLRNFDNLYNRTNTIANEAINKLSTIIIHIFIPN